MKPNITIDKIVKVAVSALICCAILSYFVKQKPPLLELVSPRQELPSFAPTFPGDTRLADRIVKSYALAIVLEQSPYLQKNINSLESIREWAHDEFQHSPDFLHPSTIATTPEGRDTVFGALGYNLFAPLHYWLQACCGEVLRYQIAKFHETSAYHSFNAAYFDFFGSDSESATLLARYQTDRAKLAIDVVLWSTVWFIGIVCGAFYLSRSKRFFEGLRVTTAAAWAVLALAYGSQAWVQGHAQALTACVFSVLLSSYFFKPFAMLKSRSGGKRLTFVYLAPRWIALAAWFTFSCICIQVVTWIKTGIPSSPDPLTLLLFSITGNFVHDPVHGKRWIGLTTAVLWLISSAWTLWQQYRLEPLPPESELGPDPLQNRTPFETSLN